MEQPSLRKITLMLAIVVALYLAANPLALYKQTYAQEPERKQVIYNTIIAFFAKHNSQPPPTDQIIEWTKKFLEEEEFSGHVFTTAEIENKVDLELQLELAKGAASFTDRMSK